MKFRIHNYILFIISFFCFNRLYTQTNKDSIYIIKGYAEVEFDTRANRDFLEKELIKLATIDAIEKQFGKVVYSENSLNIKNSNQDKKASTNTEFNSLNKTFVKADIQQVIDQKIEEKEVSGYTEVNGIKKLMISKYLTCKVICKAKESPINIEFAIQVDKILTQVDTLKSQIKNIDADIGTLKKSNIILDASSVEEKSYNIFQLLSINKTKEAETLIDWYIDYIDRVDSFDFRNYINNKNYWYIHIGRTYYFTKDILEIIKRRGFNDFFGYVYITEGIGYDKFQNKNKYYIDDKDDKLRDYQFLLNFLEPLAKVIPDNSFIFKKYLAFYLLNNLHIETNCEINIGGIERAQWVNYKGDLISNTSHVEDSAKCVREVDKWKIDRSKYPYLYELIINFLYQKGDHFDINELENHFKSNNQYFSKYGDKQTFINMYAEEFAVNGRSLASYIGRKNQYIERIERIKKFGRSNFNKYLGYEDVLIKILSNKFDH